MDSDVVALLGGLLFLLLALVGGGFTIKEISMPQIPSAARAACLVVGIGLVVLSVVSVGKEPTPVGGELAGQAATNGSSATSAAATGSPAEDSGAVVLWESLDPSEAEKHNLEVSGLRATASKDPPSLNDQVLIEYTLRNVGSSPVTFDSTFIGVRAPGDRWADTGEDNDGVVLRPGDSLRIRQAVLLDTVGAWEIWPCYELRTPNGGLGQCPDEWNRFFVKVQ